MAKNVWDMPMNQKGSNNIQQMKNLSLGNAILLCSVNTGGLMYNAFSSEISSENMSYSLPLLDLKIWIFTTILSFNFF